MGWLNITATITTNIALREHERELQTWPDIGKLWQKLQERLGKKVRVDGGESAPSVTS